MISRFLQSFWAWYERTYLVNVGLAALLFGLQFVHLIWLSLDVVALRLVGESFWQLSPFWETGMAFVDYLEIPAILSTSLVYIHALRSKGFHWGPALMLLFINSQWLHIFWITDEFILTSLIERQATMLPSWLAWIAIGIDYLELPVIYDTFRRFFVALKEHRGREFLKELAEK
ncbi:MAG: hypothetical protein Q8P71_01265 [bacterium]|nr:hypothetical protein [bacterium]